MAERTGAILMFSGDAEAAFGFYASLFDDAACKIIARYGPEAGEMEGKVMLAELKIAGQLFLATDSTVKHDFDFTPAISLYVECATKAEFERIFEALSRGGEIRMAPSDYGFSQQFGWCTDRFGVSWQVNTP